MGMDQQQEAKRKSKLAISASRQKRARESTEQHRQQEMASKLERILRVQGRSCLPDGVKFLAATTSHLDSFTASLVIDGEAVTGPRRKTVDQAVLDHRSITEALQRSGDRGAHRMLGNLRRRSERDAAIFK